MKISFENLEYEVNVTLNKKDAKLKGMASYKHKIVKGVSGCALPGQATYIMGSSGAGKTSLLNILSDRIGTKRGDKLSGNIVFNDIAPLT